MIHEVKNIDFKIKERISPKAKVWIYQSTRPFAEKEAHIINEDCDSFVNEWSAHGKSLLADYQIFFNQFICFFVDESAFVASGCSIDSSVYFIKALEKEHNLSLLNRMNVAYFDRNGEIKTMDMNDLEKAYNREEISRDTLVFNNLVATKEDMESNWIIPISESWHNRLLG